MEPGAFEFLRGQIGLEVTASPSAFMNWLRPEMRLVEKGHLEFAYTVRPEMTNPFGTLHGGVIAAIMDDAIGATLIAFEEPFFYVSINLAVDYFASAKVADVVVAVTSVNKKGKTVVNAQCELWTADKSRLLAKGYTNLLKTHPK
ncbi:PaaI family thioesterase [Flavobacterium selenitireducens]|uniref:PaaI family thioesterase n=1 Tax=Flavobacterium selenitireducens TaxID=2722704 RepID=UPI001CC2DE26|nr:PaaI family thioesterase [Flavobacterium selenitireducens]